MQFKNRQIYDNYRGQSSGYLCEGVGVGKEHKGTSGRLGMPLVLM